MVMSIGIQPLKRLKSTGWHVPTQTTRARYDLAAIASGRIYPPRHRLRAEAGRLIAKPLSAVRPELLEPALTAKQDRATALLQRLKNYTLPAGGTPPARDNRGAPQGPARAMGRRRAGWAGRRSRIYPRG